MSLEPKKLKHSSKKSWYSTSILKWVTIYCFLLNTHLFFFFFFEDNTIEFLFHRIGTYIKKIGAGDMFSAQQIPNPNNKVARGA